MKPKDLQFPFSETGERRVHYHDRFWYVPDCAPPVETFTFPGWSHPDFFGNDHPVHVEYCSGNGAWIAAKAQEHPEINWVAIEMKFKRCRKIWSKMKNLGLNNLIIICSEAMRVTRDFFPAASIDQAYINFPDPWPKKRHAKHRLVQAPFALEVGRILCQGAPFTLVTDDENYSEQMIATLDQCPLFSSAFPAPYYVNEWENYGTSYFEDLWREKGRSIRYHQFCKRP